ncbi:hypothetical protein DPMN_150465 [Dreissena polymorpha]|uniref:Uncharacterized protein n=1 Tax=Dreissena polymorpha TaxID=45954 RepID=A0A9D4FGH9_DREPO|nr:hypothetical protein DPMN_150465 [Dreissena polymorpha]
MRKHRSVSFDGAKRKFLIIKEIDEKIRYASSSGIEGIHCPRIHQSEKSFQRVS